MLVQGFGGLVDRLEASTRTKVFRPWGVCGFLSSGNGSGLVNVELAGPWPKCEVGFAKDFRGFRLCRR